MKTNVATNMEKTTKQSRVSVIVKVAMLSALAAVLMLIEFPLPFIAPDFYKIDFSELPVLIGAFAIGPVAGIFIEGIKILLNFVFNGTVTAGIGELANFAIGCSMVIPAAIIYRLKRTKMNAYIGLGTGVIFMAVAGCFLNAYLLLPTYAKAFNVPIDVMIGAGKAVNPNVNSIESFVLLTVLPFNLIKGCVVSAAVALIYKRISHLLQK